MTIAVSPSRAVSQSRGGTQTQAAATVPHVQARTQSTATEHLDLHLDRETAQQDDVEEVITSSVSSSGYGDSLTEQAMYLLQQIQAGMQHAPMPSVAGLQHIAVQQQTAAVQVSLLSPDLAPSSFSNICAEAMQACWQ